MDSMASEPGFIDELLNFSSDIDDADEEEEEQDVTDRKRALVSSLRPNGLLLGPRHSVRPWNSHELVEEELEWISNKDAFPAVESFIGVLSDDHPTAAFVASAVKHHSPISVLDTISTSNSSGSGSSGSSGSLASCFGGMPAPPRRARTNRRGRRRQQWCGGGGVLRAPEKARKRCSPAGAVIPGRKCLHCGAEKTPQWRAGPEGPKTLCNACGVRYKSGRLVPEYRPACSPSFSSELHSNSHRKVVEMRRVKQVMGLVIKQPFHPGYFSNKP